MIVVVAVVLATVLLAFTQRDRKVLFGRPSSFTIDGRHRTYRVVGQVSGTSTKLVVALHGYGGSGRQFAYYTALHNAFGNDTVGDTVGDTVVVYPDAIKEGKAGWNAQFCCGSGWKKGADDVNFLDVLITRLTAQHHIAADRVFVVGFSNGAFMAQRLAVERPALVAGLGVMSGTIGTTTNSLRPTTPVPILLTHGARDQRVAFNGGESPGDPEFDWRSFAETVNTWKTANGYSETPGNATTGSGRTVTRYTGGVAPLETIEYLNNGHVWDGWRLANVWTRRPRASRDVARFFNEVAAAAR